MCPHTFSLSFPNTQTHFSKHRKIFYVESYTAKSISILNQEVPSFLLFLQIFKPTSVIVNSSQLASSSVLYCSNQLRRMRTRTCCFLDMCSSIFTSSQSAAHVRSQLSQLPSTIHLTDATDCLELLKLTGDRNAILLTETTQAIVQKKHTRSLLKQWMLVASLGFELLEIQMPKNIHFKVYVENRNGHISCFVHYFFLFIVDSRDIYTTPNYIFVERIWLQVCEYVIIVPYTWYFAETYN